MDNNLENFDKLKNKPQMEGNAPHHCMIVHAYYPLGETRVEREALALIDEGITVDVICLKDKGEVFSETLKGVRIFRMPVKRHRDHGSVVQLLEYLLFMFYSAIYVTWRHIQKRYQVVQVHNLPDFLVFAALVPKIAGAKVILDIHDLMPDFFAEKFNKSMDSTIVRVVNFQERVSCWFADHVITVTEIWRQSLIEKGVPPEKVSVVMNLADHNIFKPINAMNLPDRKDDRFKMIYHGYIPERYGLDLILQSIDQLKSEIPNILFTLIGDGEFLPELKIMADDLNLTDTHVEFLDVVPVDQLPSLIAEADIAIVPYRNDVFTDALLPTKLLEYALMGLPTIAACTSTIAYYFDDSMVQFIEPGNLQELTHAIRELYVDPARRDQLSRGIQTFNQQYNWEASGQKYAELVKQLPQRGRQKIDMARNEN